MRIGYFIVKYPYQRQFDDYRYGGASVVACHLADGMAKRKHDVSVFTTSRDRHYSVNQDNNLTIYRYGTSMKVLTSNFSAGYFLGPLQHTTDLAHAHFDIVPGPFSALRYSKRTGVPLVVTYHGDWEENFGAIYRRAGVALFNRLLVDKLLSGAKVIVTPSKMYAERSKFLKKYREKVVAIPNGIHAGECSTSLSKPACRERLGMARDAKIILFLGYLSPYKGPDVLIKAMPSIVKQIPGAVLIVAGTGQMAGELKSLSQKLVAGDRIRFTGFVADEDKTLYYTACDVFVLPSTMSTECFPVTILEAMACQAPVVASDTGGIGDAVRNGHNGLLIPPGNIESLSAAIVRVLKDDELAAEMGKNGRQAIEKEYLWDDIVKKTERLYEDCLGGK